MTVDEAIDILKDWDGYFIGHSSDDVYDALDMAIKALEQTQWIPVSKPPKESLNSVMGWDAYRERWVFVQYIDGHFQITGKGESFDIKAWMPLPPSYQGE